MSDSCVSQNNSSLHPKPRFQNSQCHSKPVAVIYIYFTHIPLSNFQNHFRSSPPEVFLWKGILEICSKLTGEHPWRRVISIKLQFFGITLRHRRSPVNLLHIFRTPFPKNTIVWLLLSFPLQPLSGSCLIKYAWKSGLGNVIMRNSLHALPTKFRNKLLSFYCWKIAIDQNFERENNFIQRAYILTWFSLWRMHHE